MNRYKMSLEEFESHFFKGREFKSLTEYFSASRIASQLKGFSNFLWEIGPKRGHNLIRVMESTLDYSHRVLAAASINVEIELWGEQHGVIPYVVDTYGKTRITEFSHCQNCGEPGWYVVQMCCDGRECGCMGQPVEPIICSVECYNRVCGYEEKHALPTWLVSKRTEISKHYDTAAIVNEFVKIEVLKTFH